MFFIEGWRNGGVVPQIMFKFVGSSNNIIMVKIKMGAVVADARGKLGGHVFSKNRESAYMRTKVTPVNPQTSFQQNARSLLVNFSQAWRGLTQEERDAWNSAVSDFSQTNIFGDTVNPTGKNLYTKLNINLDLIGGTALDEPPNPAEVPAMQTLELNLDRGNNRVDVEFSPSPVPSNVDFLLFATAGQSPGKNFVSSEYRQIGVISAAATDPHDAEPDYVGRFGTLPALGEKLFFKVVPIENTTGQAGTSLSVSGVMV